MHEDKATTECKRKQNFVVKDGNKKNDMAKDRIDK